MTALLILAFATPAWAGPDEGAKATDTDPLVLIRHGNLYLPPPARPHDADHGARPLFREQDLASGTSPHQ